MQTRLSSLFEILTNIGVKSIIALLLQLVIFPLHGIHVTAQANVSIWLCFTVSSIFFGYLIRRHFNKREK